MLHLSEKEIKILPINSVIIPIEGDFDEPSAFSYSTNTPSSLWTGITPQLHLGYIDIKQAETVARERERAEEVKIGDFEADERLKGSGYRSKCSESDRG